MNVIADGTLSQNSSKMLQQKEEGVGREGTRSKERIMISRKASGINANKTNDNQYIIAGQVSQDSVRENSFNKSQENRQTEHAGLKNINETPSDSQGSEEKLTLEKNEISNQMNTEEKQVLKKQRTAQFGKSQENRSPQKSSKKKEQEEKLIKERLGVENVADIGEIIIQMQGYTGDAAANAGNQDQNAKQQQLRFKDLYRNPEVIGQGAYGLVIKVEKNLFNPISRSSSISHNIFQAQSFTNAARNYIDNEKLDNQQSHQSNSYVAIKVINKRELNDGGYQVLKNEALILRKMNHPNIVKFYDIYETNDFIFIEMEYIPNGTLKNMMEPDASNHKKKRFTDYESSQIIGGLLSAVDHVHSKNYVHRDLKPENVLIGDPRTTNSEIAENKTAIEIKLEEASDLRRSIKLADFGLSASFRISQAHSLDERMGTLLFMAPEQTKNQNYGKKIDIWAVGIILYLLIEGKHPLYIPGQDTAKSYHEKLIKYNPALLPSNDNSIMSPMARDIFSKLCNPMPIERYTAEQALRHPWITRDFDSPIPQTESQKVREVQADSILRNALNITFFLSVAKLRRNFATVEVKNSQKSTSSSITSARQNDQNGIFNVSEYKAKCERVIIETEERDQQIKLKREKELLEQLSPPELEKKEEEFQEEKELEANDDLTSQNTPSPIKADRNTRKKLFDFNSQNLKKNENDLKKAQQQAATVPATSLNSTSIKRVSTMVKKQSVNQSVIGSSQPQIVKKANIHYQQLFPDPAPSNEENGLPGCIIGVGGVTGPSGGSTQQAMLKRKSQFGEENGPKSTSPPAKRVKQNNSQNGKRPKVSSKAINHTGEESGHEDNLELEQLNERSPDTQRLGTAEESESGSPNTLYVKRIQSGINLNKNRPIGNKFHLNLHAIEKPERRPDQFDRANKTPLDHPRQIQGVKDAINHDDIDDQGTYTNKQTRKASKGKKRKTLDANNQQLEYENEVIQGMIKSSIEGGIQNLGRQSQSDIQKILHSQQKQKLITQNGFQSNDGSSLKKKRTLVGTNQQVKPKKMTDLSQIQDSIKFLDEQFDEIQNLSFDQPNSMVQQTGEFVSSFNIDNRPYINQQNKAQVKQTLQSKLSKQDPNSNINQDFQLPHIFNGNNNNEAITNRRVPPHHIQQEDWNYIKNGALSVQKQHQASTTKQLKGQRSLEHSGQRTHNYFFNQPHSLIQNNYQGFKDSLENNINHQHSLPQANAHQQNPIEVRRQSTNYSAIESSKQAQSLLVNQDQQQFINAHYNQTELHPAVANFDFMQFQQKYMQWKEQRASLVAQKLSNTDDPSRTIIKQQSSKLDQDDIQQQRMITDSDDFMLMAAKGVASLKQQRSTANVVLSSGPSMKTKFNQDSGEIDPPSNQRFPLDSLQYQQQTKTPLQGKGYTLDANIINGGGTTGTPGQILPHQIRLEDQLKALIAGTQQNSSTIQPIKVGSKIPMHYKNVQVVKEANIIHANLNQQINGNNVLQQQNMRPKNQNIVEGQAISNLPSPNKRNKKKNVANQQQSTTSDNSKANIVVVGNPGIDTTNMPSSHQTAINNPAKIQIVPAKIQVVVQTLNNPKQLQIQKKMMN